VPPQAAPGLAGKSLVPLLDRPDRRIKNAAYTQIAFEDVRGLAVRTDRYRYIQWHGRGGGEELYDHASDPGEFRNQAGAAGMDNVLRQHRRLAAQYPW